MMLSILENYLTFLPFHAGTVRCQPNPGSQLDFARFHIHCGEARGSGMSRLKVDLGTHRRFPNFGQSENTSFNLDSH